eukprot:CAMPEP_0119123540 /NCGR_PEP_ID=MMETSP1310-20130426/3448_1 /TAXON_ID=464262 /ORGANISM="Genus nov. species nov., Strain RCC2339" /LENGTH=546 /DNA_ID=CAMNT_0007113377 /DNA_START=111 /DNA_END=1751 /DNA_ORIENTATION=+
MVLEECLPTEPIIGDPCLQPVSWIVAVGIIGCFLLAIAMGANDVANSFGTSVGAGVLTLRNACYLASVFEFLGAVTLGSGVTKTIRKGIVDIDTFTDDPALLMLGNWCAVVGAGSWVMVATLFALPVSTTQAVVGGIIGFALIHDGWNGVDHMGLLFIMSSWIVSPLSSAVVTAIIYFCVEKYLLEATPAHEQFRRSRHFLSAAIGAVIFLVVMFFIYQQKKGQTMWYLYGFLIAIASAAVVYAAFILYFVDLLISRSVGNLGEPIKREDSVVDLNDGGKEWEDGHHGPMEDISLDSEVEMQDMAEVVTDLGEPKVEEDEPGKADDPVSSSAIADDVIQQGAEKPADAEPGNAMSGSTTLETRIAAAQIMTASFQAFAHGTNDIANVAGPMAGIWAIYTTVTVGAEVATQYWILALLGLGIVLGLWFFGRRVIETIGKRMIKVTPSRGFSVEFGTSVVVLVASFVGAPISSTHAQVGAVVGVGMYIGKDELRKSVNWRLLLNIFVSWVVTMPFAAGVSAMLYTLLRPVVVAALTVVLKEVDPPVTV